MKKKKCDYCKKLLTKYNSDIEFCDNANCYDCCIGDIPGHRD